MVVILLLNVMEVFSVGGGDLLYGLPHNVRVVPVIPVCIKVFTPLVLLLSSK